MTRIASLCMAILAPAWLYGQPKGIHEPPIFPPEIGPAAIAVTGIDGKAVDLTLTDLWKLPQHTVGTADHGVPTTFEGVLLADVLSRVDLPTGPKFQHTAASYYVLVEADDGYKAVFAWAEVDSTITDKAVYLVTRRDGKPLSAGDGPFQLVAPGEKKNTRWVRRVKALAIRRSN